MSYIKVLGGSYIKLTGNYGYNTSTVKGLAANTTIDATGATWIVSNSANQHPDADTSYLVGSGTINTYAFIVYSAGYGLTLKGGTIWGEVPMTSDWIYTYNNSAAIRIENALSATIDSWRIDKVWDAIRIAPGSQNFLINDVHLSNVRDDAIENDFKQSGIIRDTLIDGTLAGISLVNSSHLDGSANTVTLENTFIRLQSYLQDGEMTHGSLFKTDTDAPGTIPDIRLINCVFAIDDPTHNGIARLKLAWENVVESSGNVFLNLSDTPLPSNYPMPPAGFVILQGQEARDYWEQVEAAWLANHDGVGDVAVTPLPPLPGTDPADTPMTPTPPTAPTPGNTIIGTGGKNTLTGTSGDDRIEGKAAADLIYGKLGSDLLIGRHGARQVRVRYSPWIGCRCISDFNPSRKLDLPGQCHFHKAWFWDR